MEQVEVESVIGVGPKLMERMQREQDRTHAIMQRKYDWIAKQPTELQSAVAAMSRSEMRTLVQEALTHGVRNNGGHFPSGITVSYVGEAEFEWYGHKWTATGKHSKGKFMDGFWAYGADGCIVLKSNAGHVYYVTDLPEYVTGWWQYIIEGPEGLIGKV